jgi:hypothetical protein
MVRASEGTGWMWGWVGASGGGWPGSWMRTRGRACAEGREAKSGFPALVENGFACPSQRPRLMISC